MIFLLLDRANEDSDLELAKHVAMVHKTKKAPDAKAESKLKLYNEEFLRAYIAYASTFQPIIPPTLHQYIVAKYVEKRQAQRDGRLEEIAYMYITPRTLLGIIRLSQSLAKLYFREEVQQADVDEAIKLMDYSIKSLNTDNSRVKRPNKKTDEMSEIIAQVREICMESSKRGNTDLEDCFKTLSKPNKMGKKLTKEKLQATLEHYQNLKVVYMDDQSRIYFL